MSKKHKNKEDNVVETEITNVNGYVSNCERLNIREEPNISSKVLMILKNAEGVLIDLTFEDDIFYKISTYYGVDGYAMKSYIEIR